MAAKNSSKQPRKLTAVLASLLTVFAALAYILFGENIASLVDTGDYSKLIRYFTASTPEGQIEVHIIDVGQGDSILIRSPDGDILIDAGPNSCEQNLKAHLVACGVDELAYFICTHPHEDHIGSADMIVDSFPIQTLLMPDYTANTVVFQKLLDEIEEHNVTVEIPEAGDVYQLGELEFTVLAPLSDFDDANNMSLVLRLTYGATAFLFTGDAETPSEKQILDAYRKSELDCDFLKLGHHGSSTSTSAEFLAAVSPEIVAISCGRDNEYGHPHYETLKRLESAGIETILRTDEMGTIVLVSDGSTLSTAN